MEFSSEQVVEDNTKRPPTQMGKLLIIAVITEYSSNNV